MAAVEQERLTLESLKERAVESLRALVFGRLGEQLEKFEQKTSVTRADAGGVPVRVRLPSVREIAPQAILVGTVLLVPALLQLVGRSRRRGRGRRSRR